MLSFEPLTFDRNDSLTVELRPFAWQQMLIRFPHRQRIEWRPLKEWFWRWFRESDEGNEMSLLGVVHCLTDPELRKSTIALEADLGSAPVEAFEELLDAIALLGVTRCRIGKTRNGTSKSSDN